MPDLSCSPPFLPSVSFILSRPVAHRQYHHSEGQPCHRGPQLCVLTLGKHVLKSQCGRPGRSLRVLIPAAAVLTALSCQRLEACPHSFLMNSSLSLNSTSFKVSQWWQNEARFLLNIIGLSLAHFLTQPLFSEVSGARPLLSSFLSAVFSKFPRESPFPLL